MDRDSYFFSSSFFSCTNADGAAALLGGWLNGISSSAFIASPAMCKCDNLNVASWLSLNHWCTCTPTPVLVYWGNYFRAYCTVRWLKPIYDTKMVGALPHSSTRGWHCCPRRGQGDVSFKLRAVLKTIWILGQPLEARSSKCFTGSPFTRHEHFLWNHASMSVQLTGCCSKHHLQGKWT